MIRGADVELDKLRILMKVAETGSFTRAAEEMGYTQSAVSHAVQSLEQELSLPLIQRGKRNSTLSPAAEELLPKMRELLQMEQYIIETAQRMNHLEVGTVRIGGFGEIAMQSLSEAIPEFQMRYPKIRVEVYSGRYDESEHWLLSGRVDCGLFPLSAIGGKAESKLETCELRRSRLFAVFPQGHPLGRQDTVTLEDLSRFPVVSIWSHTEENRHDQLSIANPLGLSRYYVSSSEVARYYVKCGLGVSVLPSWGQHPLFSEDYRETLDFRPLSLENQYILGIGIQSLEACPPAARRFVEFMQEFFAAEK